MFYLNYYTNHFQLHQEYLFGKFLSGGALLLMLSYVFLQVGDRRVGLLLVVYKTTLLTVEVIPIILCRQGFPPCMNRTWERRCLSKCASYAFISSSDSPLSPPLRSPHWHLPILTLLSVYVFRHDTYKVLFWNSILKLQQDEATASKKSL